MKDFSDTDNIIDKVSSKLNISRDKVEYVFGFLIEHLRFLTTLKDKVTIIIPYIGNFYVKTSHLRKEINKLEVEVTKEDLSGLKTIKLDTLKSQAEIVSKDYCPGKSKNKNHYLKNKLKNKTITERRNFEELENWQNETEK